MATTLSEYDSTRSIQDMWLDAEEKFRLATKDKFKQPLTFQTAMSKLDEALDPVDPKDTEESARKKRMKAVAKNILNLVQLLGGLAAQGAGMVFGPADMCFNAVHAILDIPARIGQLWEDVERLLEDTSSCLQQFKIYQRIERITMLDSEFRQSVSKLLATFVNMVTLCLKFCDHRKRKVFTHHVKLLLFDDDSGVKDMLDKFRALTQRHQNISDAVTLERIVQAQHDASGNFKMIWNKLNEESQKTQKGVDLLVTDLAERKSMKAKHEMLEGLGKKLGGLDLSKLKESSAVEPRANLLADSGAWLEKDDDYQAWARFSVKSPRILMLTGDAGSGKSHLLSSVFHRLREQYDSTSKQQARLSIAYHAFDTDKKAMYTAKALESSTANAPGIAVAMAPASNTPDALSNAAASSYNQVMQSLRSIAAQFTSDDIFARNLDQRLDRQNVVMGKDTNVDDAFSILFSEKTMPTHSDTFYVLLLDGLDQLKNDQAIELFRAIDQARTTQLKVLISSLPGTIDKCLKSAPQVSDYARIELEDDNNQPDIKLYIENELKREDLFRSDDANTQSVVEKIRQNLPDIACGNFRKAQVVLDEVRRALDSIEVDFPATLNLIDASTLQNSQVIRRLVTELESSLSSVEIQHLNQILTWTIYAKRQLTVDDMRAALFLLKSKKITYDLKNVVEKKFHKLLRVEDDVFTMQKDEMEDFFRNQSRYTADSEEASISMNITIRNAKLPQVQRFLWKLSENIVFDFKNSSADAEAKTPISANQVDCHLIILDRCLDLLLEPKKEESSRLASYATAFVLQHLPDFQATDGGDKLTDLEKQKIADKLVSLLYDSDLDHHLTPDFFWEGHLLEEAPLLNVKAIMSDKVATKNFRYKQQAWIKDLVDGNPAVALHEVAKLVAKHWLCRRDHHCWSPYNWLEQYLELKDSMELKDSTAPKIVSVDDQSPQNQSCAKEDDEEPASVIPIPCDPIDADAVNNRAGLEDATTDEDHAAGSEAEDHEASDTCSTSIDRIITWLESVGEHFTENALWHERLGDTYRTLAFFTGSAVRMREKAHDHFESAKKLADVSWQVYEGSAEVYGDSEKYDLAKSEMDGALDRLRNLTDRSEDDTTALVKCLGTSARWCVQLKDCKEAIHRLQEALSVAPEVVHIKHDIFKTFCENGEESRAVDFLVGLAEKPDQDAKSTGLEHLLERLCDHPDALERYETIARAARLHNRTRLILEALENCQKSLQSSVQNGSESEELVALKLFHGVTLAYYDSGIDCPESALDHWRECMRMGFDSDDGWKQLHAYNAAKCVLEHLACARAEMPNTDGEPDKLGEMRTMMQKGSQSTVYGNEVRRLLASRYTLADQTEEARKLLLPDMKCALGLLSDDDPSNDTRGFRDLSNVLRSAGDNADCLSAWSLMGPTERHSASKPNAAQGQHCGSWCDGRCEGYDKLTWANSMWCCKICDDVQLCSPCLDLLHSRALKRRICSPEHHWLLMPSWTSEFAITGKDKVRVGGTLPPAEGQHQEGHRIGGDIVTIKEFLNMIREKWGITTGDTPDQGSDPTRTLQRAQTYT